MEKPGAPLTGAGPPRSAMPLFGLSNGLPWGPMAGAGGDGDKHHAVDENSGAERSAAVAGCSRLP